MSYSWVQVKSDLASRMHAGISIVTTVSYSECTMKCTSEHKVSSNGQLYNVLRIRCLRGLICVRKPHLPFCVYDGNSLIQQQPTYCTEGILELHDLLLRWTRPRMTLVGHLLCERWWYLGRQCTGTNWLSDRLIPFLKEVDRIYVPIINCIIVCLLNGINGSVLVRILKCWSGLTSTAPDDHEFANNAWGF